MTLKLPEVTLVAIDSVAHDLTRMALEDSLKQIEPADVLVWSDKRAAVPKGARWMTSNCRSLEEVARTLWYAVPSAVRTSHYLLVQWDGWVLDADQWDDRFLLYDYIGAPWPWHETRRVGNGGFSLRSIELGRFLANRPTEFPLQGMEDDMLCRAYRPFLEIFAHEWAPDELAEQFSFERGHPRPTFGFHGNWNFPAVLEPEALWQRVECANDYVRSKPEWGELTAQLEAAQ